MGLVRPARPRAGVGPGRPHRGPAADARSPRPVARHQPVDPGGAGGGPRRAAPPRRPGHGPARGPRHRAQRRCGARARATLRRGRPHRADDAPAAAPRAVLGDGRTVARRRLAGAAGGARRDRGQAGRRDVDPRRRARRHARGRPHRRGGRPARARPTSPARPRCGGCGASSSARPRRGPGSAPLPVAWLPENAEHPPSVDHPWRVAHPIVCALRLAADPARGREVVESWGIVPGATR